MSHTHIFVLIFYKSTANAHHPHFFIHPNDILAIYGQCPQPHFLFVFYQFTANPHDSSKKEVVLEDYPVGTINFQLWNIYKELK